MSLAHIGKPGNGRKVIMCYNPDMTIYAIFESITAALAHFNKPLHCRCGLRRNLKAGTLYNKKYWKYGKDTSNISSNG